MFHSQIAAPSARSSRHHRSLRPPPRRAPARFYVVSSGRAGLPCAAAAKSCSCSFYSPHKSNMLKRETKCVSIWLRGEAGGSSLRAAKGSSAAGSPESAGPCQVWLPRALPSRPGGFGSARLRSPPSPPGCGGLWRHLRTGGRGQFWTVFSRAAVAGQGSYRWKHKRFHLNSWKPQISRKERKWHVPSAPNFPIFINNRKPGCLDKHFYLQSKW